MMNKKDNLPKVFKNPNDTTYNRIKKRPVGNLSNRTVTITTSKESIDYPNAFDLQLKSRQWGRNSVYVFHPFYKFKEYMFLFPDCTIKNISETEGICYYHHNFIYYQDRWCSVGEIIKDRETCPHAPLDDFLSFCRFSLKLGSYHTFDYTYFNLKSSQHIDLKGNAIQPIREILKKNGFLEKDDRGKRSKEEEKIRQERKKVIIKACKESKNKRRIPINHIQKRWDEYLKKNYPNDIKEFEKRLMSDNTIRRILREERYI